nr:unnamed protein product [Digitaria exilis]
MQTSWCRKPYYPNSDTRGTETGACEYGMFGAMLNNGDVSASASLYRNGVGCGACYQPEHTLDGTGQGKDAGATWLNLGYVRIEYRSDMGKNIIFKIAESSNFPYYLEFEIWYQQGNQDIIAVQLCETEPDMSASGPNSWGSMGCRLPAK